jgi:uncharacterized membrane protein YgdD (TMEM256/DUF423 family)
MSRHAIHDGTVDMALTIFITAAGLMGAGGVVLLAAAAHAAPGAGLDSAGQILMFHAIALLGAVAASSQGLLARPLAIAAMTGFVVGALLFSGDITLRAFAGQRLFPLAAPSGGIILIVSWLAIAAAGIMAAVRTN